MNLVSIHSDAELSGFFSVIDSKFNYWVGLNDIAQEGTWVWSDGTPNDYQNWAPSEPNDYLSNEDCVRTIGGLIPNQKFNDAPCANPNRFVCQKPHYATTSFEIKLQEDLCATASISIPA